MIYHPETERLSHYFYASLPQQFDAIIHIEDTRAVQPLDHQSEAATGEAETFPSAL